MKILVINAGSSSLKYQLFDMAKEELLAKGLCERIGIKGSKLGHKAYHGQEVVIEEEMKTHADAIELVNAALMNAQHGVIKNMSEISAVGHRVAHGGEYFTSSSLIDDNVKKAIEECCALAPLHNLPNLTGIKACEKVMPDVPMVAVFDTAFHQTMPEKAYLYPIPYEMYEKYKIRRYGFHGTSHKYVAERAAAVLNKSIEKLKIVTCHLGNGSSIAAVDGGKSVDTSMGFTPLAGVVMGTRCGDIDPAIVTFIMEKEKLDSNAADALLNKKSGFLGISGVSSDMRDLSIAARDGNERAKIAIKMFVYSIKRYIGAYAAAMGGLDAIVFTAGIGENSSSLREKITSDLAFLGVSIDAEKNKVRGKEIDISADDAKVKTLIIPTNEELSIALQTKKIVSK